MRNRRWLLRRWLLLLFLVSGCVPERVQESLPPGNGDSSVAGLGEIASRGSGIFVSPVGHLVTASHVIHGCANISFMDHFGKSHGASVLVDVPHRDIALLEVAYRPAYWVLFSDGAPRQGQSVRLVGVLGVRSLGPKLFGEGQRRLPSIRIADGFIQKLRSDLVGEDGQSLGYSYQIFSLDHIPPGFSGGGILDGSGRLVGIVSATNLTIENLVVGIPHQELEDQWKAATNKPAGHGTGQRVRKATGVVFCHR